MQIFATALLLIASVASLDVDIMDGDNKAFTANFMTNYKVSGEAAA